MAENKEIGERLKEARRAKGLTQEQACKKAGIPKPQTLSKYEQGNTPRLGALMDLVKLYDVSADWILFGEERANKSENQKSPVEYLAQLVEAADKLGLQIEGHVKNFADPIEICINMCSTKYAEIDAFSSSWKKFRALFNEKELDFDDYEALLHRKLPKQLSEKNAEPDPCEVAIENGEMPF